MLIDLRTICHKYNFVPKGIIHVGAHKAEELAVYKELGIKNILFIEANPELCEWMKQNITDPNVKILNYAVSNKDNEVVKFNISNNGESSSLLELKEHLVEHPNIHYINSIEVTTKKLDTIFELEGLNIEDYDMMNLDIQGAELNALKGFIYHLDFIDYLYTEVNEAELYENCALLPEMDQFLAFFDLKRKETHMTRHRWGDAFYGK